MREKLLKLLNKEWFVIVLGIIISAVLTLSVVLIALRGNEKHKYYVRGTSLDAFNSNFSSYEGAQTGSQVKALISRLCANAMTYEDEIGKIPCVSYNTEEGVDDPNKGISGQAYCVINDGEIDEYTKNLNELSDGMILKHTYYVKTTINKVGFIRGITINYSKEDKKNENFEATKEYDGGLYGIKTKKGISGPIK